MTGSCRPGCGRSGVRDRSGPSGRTACGSAPVGATRAGGGPSRLVPATWREEERNGAATAGVTHGSGDGGGVS